MGDKLPYEGLCSDEDTERDLNLTAFCIAAIAGASSPLVPAAHSRTPASSSFPVGTLSCFNGILTKTATN